MKEALFYRRMAGSDKGKVQCQLCPHNCIIANGKSGICVARRNERGRLYSAVYGKLCSMGVDPIEKKPLFHFAPGTKCLSICTVGCNLTCSFCQNSDISHPPSGEVSGEDMAAERIIEIAKQQRLPGIAYTYTEPTIAWEFYYELMKLAREQGLYNVWVSNGYINPEPARKIAGYMDAINVDLKGDVKFYQKLCGAPSEKPMHKALMIYKEEGVCIEVTNLIIPGYNDEPGQVGKLAGWVMENLGRETPLHFSRFYPQYKMTDVEPTPVKTLETAAETAKKAGMRYVYIGNVPGHAWEDTCCPKCGSAIIRRSGLTLSEFRDACDKCGLEVPIAGRKWMR